MGRGLRGAGVILAAGVVAGGVLALAPAALASTSPPSVTPASGTPQLNKTGTTEQVRQLVPCGGTMYAVGRFTSIRKGRRVYARNNIFAFKESAHYTVSSWNPNVNGTVNTIAFDGTDCSHAYIGGKFTKVGGTAVHDIAEIDTTTGAVVPGFAHNAQWQVETLLGYHGHILAGGYFRAINGSKRKYFASLNAVTGKDDGFINLNISGHYTYSYGGKTSATNGTRVYNQQLSHGGTLDLVEGDFTSVGGKARQQIFMLNLATSPATVTGWTSSQFNGHCWFTEPFYIQAGAWSPDDQTIFIGDTGYRPYNGTTTAKRSGLCDSASAWPATQASVHDKWINYTGCDSLFSAAADDTTAYFGGHERWSSNPNGCDHQGSGGIYAPGMEGLSYSGKLTYNPHRGRGLGADDMLVRPEGLWIASDNAQNTNNCGVTSSGKPAYGHAGICLLPY